MNEIMKHLIFRLDATGFTVWISDGKIEHQLIDCKNYMVECDDALLSIKRILWLFKKKLGNGETTYHAKELQWDLKEFERPKIRPDTRDIDYSSIPRSDCCDQCPNCGYPPFYNDYLDNREIILEDALNLIECEMCGTYYFELTSK